MVHALDNTQHALKHFIITVKWRPVENDAPAKNPEDSSHTLWNNNQTHALIAYFKDNPINH